MFRAIVRLKIKKPLSCHGTSASPAAMSCRNCRRPLRYYENLWDQLRTSANIYKVCPCMPIYTQKRSFRANGYGCKWDEKGAGRDCKTHCHNLPYSPKIPYGPKYLTHFQHFLKCKTSKIQKHSKPKVLDCVLCSTGAASRCGERQT